MTDITTLGIVLILAFLVFAWITAGRALRS